VYPTFFTPGGELVKSHKEEDSLATTISLRRQCLRLLRGYKAGPVAIGLLAAVLPLWAAGGQYIANNTPPYVSAAKNLGTVDPSTTLDVSIWLQPHNRGALDAMAQELYDASSPIYRRWLKNSDIVAQFAPTAAEAKTVQEFLESNSLAMQKVGPNNFYVRARGTVADIEKAFHVQLNNYQVGNQVLRSNASDPYIEGPAAPLVQVVSGLDSGAFQYSFQVRPTNPGNSTSNKAGVSDAVAAAAVAGFQSVCFPGPKTENYTPSGTYPKATYTGNTYYAAEGGCGYSPANVYAAYHLNNLYAEGYNGAGQTIVIIDACGSPTILSDANAFSEKFGLPRLTPANFAVVNYPFPSTCAGVWSNINVDIEWAHAIAPGANIINLIIPYEFPDFEDTDEAEYYAISAGLGNVISGGFFTAEIQVSPAELDKENLISELAAVSGVATNFASGDVADWGFIPGSPSVSAPADLPYATGVGGTSLALNSDNSILFQTGWETHISILLDDGLIHDPPTLLDFGDFYSGSGGGSSKVFAKPSFQKSVAGKFRQVPDISWLSDPFTGGLIVVSEPDKVPLQTWYAAGGTELSTAMFSALWAIANQEAGVPLGQAAPYLYAMPSTTITDIVPYTSSTNFTAVIEPSASEVQRYNTLQSMALVPSPPFGKFYSAIVDDPSGEVFGVSFGGDYHLKVTTGWDEVTGLGAPNDAKAFADWFAPASAVK
jgi:subtilase family serine protease